MPEKVEEDPYLLDCYWKRRAENEVNETCNAQNYMNKLLQLIKEDKTLKCRTDALFITGFLRTKKYNVEKAWKMLRQYYEVRRKYSSYYELCLPDEKPQVFNLNSIFYLPDRDNEGRGIIVARPGKFDVDIMTAKEVVQLLNICLEIFANDSKLQITGVQLIIDLKNFSVYQQSKLITFTNIWIVVNLIQDSFPLRLQGMQIVNQPWFFDALFTLFKPFLKEKLRKRIIIHGTNMESLHKYIPKSILPAEYGGAQSEISSDHFINDVRRYTNKLKEWSKFGFHILQ